MRIKRILASAFALDGDDGVERDQAGAPVAFRIWRAGANATDFGVHVFSAESAKKLLAQQATRGNLFSIDVDHLSLNADAPPESHKAVGWHRVDARDSSDGPEFWAVDVQWTPAVKSGLESRPPEWRYFSPAYDVDKKTGEIVGYLNTALTNNPATHFVTQLAAVSAARETPKMADYAAIAAALLGDDEKKKDEAKAALAAMSDDDRAKCKAAIAAAFGDDEPKPKDGEDKAARASESGDVAPKAPEPKETARAAEEPKPKDGEDPEATAKATKANAAASATILAGLGDIDRRTKALEKSEEERERTAIFATRTDLTPSQRKYLEGKKPSEIREVLAAMAPPAAAAGKTASTAQPGTVPTRGHSQGGDGGSQGVRAAQLAGEEREKLLQKFGRRGESAMPHWEGNEFVLPTITPTTALAILARHAKDFGSDANVPTRASMPLYSGMIERMGETFRGARV